MRTYIDARTAVPVITTAPSAGLAVRTTSTALAPRQRVVHAPTILRTARPTTTLAWLRRAALVACSVAVSFAAMGAAGYLVAMTAFGAAVAVTGAEVAAAAVIAVAVAISTYTCCRYCGR